jgi:hypothetical protein
MVMAINSEAQLRQALRQIRSLDPNDVSAIVGSAHFNAKRELDGIFAGPLIAKATPSQIEGFLIAAGARHPFYGGAVGGNVVYPDEYPTGGNPPCVPRDNYFGWAPARP